MVFPGFPVPDAPIDEIDGGPLYRDILLGQYINEKRHLVALQGEIYFAALAAFGEL